MSYFQETAAKLRERLAWLARNRTILVGSDENRHNRIGFVSDESVRLFTEAAILEVCDKVAPETVFVQTEPGRVVLMLRGSFFASIDSADTSGGFEVSIEENEPVPYANLTDALEAAYRSARKEIAETYPEEPDQQKTAPESSGGNDAKETAPKPKRQTTTSKRARS